MLFLAALFLRLGLLLVSVDMPGDGPSRAFMAYAWSKSPYFVTHSGWPPGFLYIPGVFNFVVHGPLFSTRIFNLILGSFTIPLYYLLIRRVYNRGVALFASLLLVVFPLHVGLSVSSLAEISFLFATIASMVLLTGTSEGQKGWARLGLSFFCLSWAQMTRYEAWWVTPAFALYCWSKTQRVGRAILTLFIFLLVPSAWMLGNYFYTGKALLELHTVRHGASLMNAQRLDLLEALNFLGSMAVFHLGEILIVVMVGGVIWQLVLIARSANKPEQVLYIAVVCLYWLGMVYLAMNIGATVWNRFLLFGFVISLPLVFLPFIGPWMYHRRSLAMIVCVILVAVGISTFPRQRPLWVTVQRPTEIKNLVAWLKESPYRNDPLLVTDMGWQATYIPLYFPEVRMGMVSPWVEDDEVYDFLQNQPPALLITRAGESGLQARIEKILGKAIAEHRLVHKEGAINVYLLAAQPQ
jgi:4-amino-4-deoxy-L-arabinose transferase-like glycosyltransferase